MVPLIVGLVVFFGIHLVPTVPELRDGLRQRLGHGGYMAVFSLLSLVGLIVIVIGYAKFAGGAMPGKNPQIWYPPAWTRHLNFLLMLVAMVLLVAAYVPSRLRTAAKHPMLAAIKLWALAHLLVRGDLASMVLFGSFLVWAIYDRVSVGKRDARGPLGAVTGGLAGDVIAVGGGLALYAFMMLGGHQWLIGIALVPGWSLT